MVQSFFCVIFFSFCSNLSIWPGRQVVPYESRCYTPIFDGLDLNVVQDCFEMVVVTLHTIDCSIFITDYWCLDEESNVTKWAGQDGGGGGQL